MTVVRPPDDLSPIAPDAGATAPRATPHGAWVLVAAILGSSMAFVDGTVVSVALPVLQRELGAAAADAQWVVESYALVLAGFILAGGALSDRFGRRLVFALGVVIFAAASAACGAAPSAEWLIGARAVQGFGAALLVPGSLAILGAAFDGAERARAIGSWSAFSALAGAAGPVLGGWLVEQFSWRWVFYINLPLAVAVLVITARFVPESRARAGDPLDWPGAIAATVGLGGLVTAALEASRLGATAPLVVVAFVLGVLALALFVRIETRSAAPMVPLVLFRNRTFAGANLLTLLLYAAIGGTLFFVPFNLIQVQGYSATAAGASLLPLTIALILLGRRSAVLMTRYGARVMLTIGPAVAALGFALFTLPGIGGSYWSTFFPAALVLGIGMGLTVAPLTTTVMGAVAPDRVGTASGVNNAVARTAAVVALAAMAVVSAWTFNRSFDRGLRDLRLPPAAAAALAAERVNMAAAAVPEGLSAEQGERVQRTIDLAFVASFRAVMLLAAGLAATSALVGWRTVEREPEPRTA